MNTECKIKPFHSERSGGGTNIWIVHDDVRYYSRVNYMMQDSYGHRNMCIDHFHKRRAGWGVTDAQVPKPVA